MQTWIIWKENNPLLLKSNRYPREQIKSLVTNGVFKSCFCPVASLVSETFTSQLYGSAVAASLSSSSISWWSTSSCVCASLLLFRFCLTSPRLIHSAPCTAHRSVGLFSAWAGRFVFVVWGVFVLGSDVHWTVLHRAAAV